MRLAILATAMMAFSLNAATLKVGDPAPKLETGKWIQGEPVKAFEKDKAYIVEFWATWCGPCRTTIPHLNELHNKFKDKGLVVIGQDVWEQDEAEVPKFVKQMGNKMTYRVALDDKSGNTKGKMAANWMEAAGQNGIPSAFIVDKGGKIAWIGHPMTLKEKTIEEILAGTFDVNQAAADSEKKKAQEGKVNDAWRNYNVATKSKDWNKAEGHLKEMEELLGEDERANIDMIRLRMNLTKEDAAAAEKIAARVASSQQENAQFQNQIAWTIATASSPSKTLLEIAEKSATRANDLEKGRDASILDTVARVQFVKGDKVGAVATQEKALAVADDRTKKEMQKTLEAYKAGRLPEE